MNPDEVTITISKNDIGFIMHEAAAFANNYHTRMMHNEKETKHSGSLSTCEHYYCSRFWATRRRIVALVYPKLDGEPPRR